MIAVGGFESNKALIGGWGLRLCSRIVPACCILSAQVAQFEEADCGHAYVRPFREAGKDGGQCSVGRESG